MMWRCGVLPLIGVFLIVASIIANTESLAVMSVDLGSDYMKIAIVKPGVPMEIVLNREGRRKTPVVVAMSNGERVFGDAALPVAVRYPKASYMYLQDLLGKTLDNPQVEKYRTRFPLHDLEEDPETKTLIIKHDEDNSYSPEELLAMILETSKEYADKFAEQPISEAVITVPPFFNQAERRAMLRVADMAGIKVLQLMNDNTAVALNYGVFRRKTFNATAQHYMFFDMGASSTTATVVAYQIVKNKNPVTGIVDTYPQLTVKGVGFDRNLGGMDFQLRLRNHLAGLFNAQHKTEQDVRTSPRAMAKLLKEASRLKHVLSANTVHMSQVESLLDDQDFKSKVTRDEYNEMCSDLFERIKKPVEEAMKASQLTWDEISEVILMGGGTRMPKVQETLQQIIGRDELGKSINTDEAVAMGAVYQAAHLSKGFKVKQFAIKDANVYPVQVEFERARSGDDPNTVSKVIKRTLFGYMNPYPQKKVMTFNKHVHDFNFDVNYGDLGFLDEDHIMAFGNLKLQKVGLNGLDPIFIKHGHTSEPKGIKAHFRMDESGILTLDKVESIFEKPADAKKDEPSTFSKIGSFFFGGSDSDEKESVVEKEETEAREEDRNKESEDDTNEKDEKTSEDEEKTKDEEDEKKTKAEEEKEEVKDKEKKEETDESKKDEAKTKDEKDEKKEEEKEDDTKKDAEGEEKKAEKVEEKKEPKPTVIKENVRADTVMVDLPEPTAEHLQASKKKIADLKKRDQEREELGKSTNDLEAFIIETQDKLYHDIYEKCSTEEEREKIRGVLSQASDWLYDQDDTVKKEAYKSKLKDLKKETKELFARVKEFEERPQALEALRIMVNHSTVFLAAMKNLTGEAGEQPFTQIEYDTLEKLVIETKEWNTTMIAEQAKVPAHEKPVLLIEDVAKKLRDLDREVKYLINKAKYFRPKPKEKEENKTEQTIVEDKPLTEEQPAQPASEEGEEEVASEAEADMASEAEADTITDTPPTDAGQKEETLELPSADKKDSPKDESKPVDTQTEETTTSSKSKGREPDDEL